MWNQHQQNLFSSYFQPFCHLSENLNCYSLYLVQMPLNQFYSCDFHYQRIEYMDSKNYTQLNQQIRFQEHEPPSSPRINQIPEKNSREEKEKDRNMVSNSLKVFRKYATDACKLRNSLIDQIIQAKRLQYSKQEFMKDLNKRIPKQLNYIGTKFLNRVIEKKQKDQNFAVVFRTLLYFYYRKEVYPTVNTSSKIVSEAKKKQLIGIRKIIENCFT